MFTVSTEQYVIIATIFVFMVCDIIMGLIGAFANNDYRSDKMRSGLFRKSSLVVVILIALVLDNVEYIVNINNNIPIFKTVGVYIVLMELSSILENTVKISPDLANSKFISLFTNKINEPKENQAHE